MKKLVSAAAFAFAGLSLSSTSALAALPYNSGDLLLGFRASGGTGAPRDYVVNVGPASQFLSGSGSITVPGPGNIAADLSSSSGALGLFGATWNTRADVSWGIVGTDLAADPTNTLYATRARTSPGIQAQAWVRRANSGQSTTNSVIRAFISGYLNSDANAVSPAGTIQATGFANSYASFTSGSVDFGFFSSVEGDFTNGTAGSVLDLFRITPNANGGGSQHLGQFALDNAGTLTFTFDNVTLPPTLTSPATNALSANPVAVGFTLPETAQSGSVHLAFSNGGPVSTLTLSAANETGSFHTFSFNPANPTASASVASGSAIPDGVYTVSLSYQDSLGNAAAAATSTNVLIDTTAPTVDASGVATTGYTDAETLPDLRGSVSVGDLSSTTLVQSPAPGAALAIGTLDVTFTATDALGHVTSQIVTLTVGSASPVTTVLAAKSGPVPGAGVSGSGIAAGATFFTFGIPSINDAGAVAYAAKWKAVPASGSGTGIFAGNPAALVAKVGQPVPSIAGAIFKAFKDPVINAGGRVAFIATIGGTGITSANDTVVVTNAFTGSLALVAQEGTTTVGVANSTIKAFTNISLQGAEVLFTAKLKDGIPAVTTTNDDIALAATSGGVKTIVREGQTYGATTVKSFRLLGPVTGSPDQARAHAEGTATFALTLADKKQLLVDGDGLTLTPFATSGTPTGGTALPLATFKTFGFVAADGAQEAVTATLTPKVGGVLSTDASGVFLGTGSAFEPIIRLGAPAPGVSGSVFSAFNDPVLANGAVAFPAKVKDTTTKLAIASLWWKPASGSVTLISTLHTPPADIAPGATWKKFTSLGLAGGASPAPLFYAQLTQGIGGVTPANDYGVWAVDHTGTLRLLVREGDSIGGKTVKSINVLKAVPGSVGAQHSFNNSRKVIYQTAFTDGTSAIATTTIP